MINLILKLKGISNKLKNECDIKTIQTDGNLIVLKFQKIVKKTPTQIKEDLNFTKEEINKMVGIDPGKYNLIASSHKIILKNKQLKHFSGLNDINYYTNYLITKNEMKEIYTDLHQSCKTTKSSVINSKINSFLRNFNNLYKFNCNKKLNELKFKYYIRKNNYLDHFINLKFKDKIIIFGSVKVHSWTCKKYGFTENMIKRFKKLKFKIYLQDELNTTKLCHLCNKILKEPKIPSTCKKENKKRINGVRKCVCNNLFQNRDVNASVNILKKFKRIINIQNLI